MKKVDHHRILGRVSKMEEVEFEIHHDKGVVELGVEVDDFVFHVSEGKLVIKVNEKQVRDLYRNLARLRHIWGKNK